MLFRWCYFWLFCINNEFFFSVSCSPSFILYYYLCMNILNIYERTHTSYCHWIRFSWKDANDGIGVYCVWSIVSHVQCLVFSVIIDRYWQRLSRMKMLIHSISSRCRAMHRNSTPVFLSIFRFQGANRLQALDFLSRPRKHELSFSETVYVSCAKYVRIERKILT